MSTRELRKFLSGIGVFLLPILTVLLATVVLKGDPMSATPSVRVAHKVAETTLPAAVQRSWNDRELAAAEHIRELSGKPFGSTPFHYMPIAHAPEEEFVVNEPAPATMDDLEPPLHAVIRAIVTTSGESIALINGNRHRVGDVINDGRWRVVQMSSDTRTVTFEHTVTGERQIVAVLGP